MKRCLVLAGVAVLLALVGCGSSSSESSESYGAQSRGERRHIQRQADRRRAVLRHRGQVAARRRAASHARFLAIRDRQAQARQHRLEEHEAEEPSPEESSECDPNYAGACLDPTASDYDCEGGSGDGPKYTGTVTVVGEDHYGLDSDGDGVGCEG
jgi:hypothetical protein